MSEIQQGDYVSFNAPGRFGREEPRTMVGLVVGMKKGGWTTPSKVTIACNGEVYHRSTDDCIKCNKELLGIVAKQYGEMFKEALTKSLLTDGGEEK